ncbi:MAG: hypothetical protein K8W52_14585, partial [Deltaproteobacteria bacterium]|nr:hypothetical protein [Deltaproteobacteria bacterium]
PIAAQAWPALTRVSIDGYRTADAARWKACFAGVADLELRGGKTDEWLAANLDNPFCDWIDRDAAVGKRAAAAWRTARAALGAGVTAAAASRVLKAFVAVFNAIDAKTGIDTIDREEIAEAFIGLASEAGLDPAVAEARLDEWRDF